MSDTSISQALAIWEFASIVDGIAAADAIAKGSPVDSLLTGTTHPGKYVVMVLGNTASVAVARDIVVDVGSAVADSRFLPDIASSVFAAATRKRTTVDASGDAVGVIETSSVSSAVDAADAAVKAADVRLSALRLADGIGGKAYVVVDGDVGDVDAAVQAADERAGDQLVASVVIPQLTAELREDLAASARFNTRVRAHKGES